MNKIKRQYPLKESEKKALFKRLFEKFNKSPERTFGVKPKIEVVEFHERKVFIVNGKPLLIEVKDDLIPTLLCEDLVQQLSKVIVDMGAIPHICNGADIMAPGIVKIEGEFEEGDLVAVLDEKHGKTIAIAKALLNSRDARKLRHGKIFENIHHVGDQVWRISREILGNERVKT
ncbi:MAG: DUF1947 domain-containing protein [Candidatus Bathyarchaeia archaeon]|nr:DUF1947 domain-containing protein [Candidatus Bathyarchaeota archaeon]